MAATATPAKKKKAASPGVSAQRLRKLEDELADAKELIAIHGRFFEKLQEFSDLVRQAKIDESALIEREANLKEQLANTREELREVRNLISGANSGVIALIEPGPTEFMPLFDHMKPSDPKVHGKNAVEWRTQPIAVLRISPAAAEALIAAEICFVGQLQDLILDDPEAWFDQLAGVSAPMAAAIADKLNDFVKKGGQS